MRIRNKVPPKTADFYRLSCQQTGEKAQNILMLSFIWETRMILRLWLHAVQLTFGLFKRFFLMGFSPEGFPLMRTVMGKWEGLWVWMVPWTGAVFCALSCKNDEQHMLVFESKSDFWVQQHFGVPLIYLCKLLFVYKQASIYCLNVSVCNRQSGVYACESIHTSVCVMCADFWQRWR